MTEDEWNKLRSEAIMTAFRTGRPVLADTENGMRFADEPKPKRNWWQRVKEWLV